MQTHATAYSSPGWQRSSPRRRATAIALTVAAELLFVLILLGINPPLPDLVPRSPTPTMIDIAPEAASPRRAPTPQAKTRPVKQTMAPPRPRLPTTAEPPLPWVPLGKAEMAAADIANLGSQAAGAAEASSSAAAGPGEGPGGARLYNAEWYREPTNGELAYYLPKSGVPQGSWAQIACKTIDRYHVDDCRLLGESPRGSGLARAMRLASWQFLVRPPRIDGKPLVGSWVRIRIDFTESSRD